MAFLSGRRSRSGQHTDDRLLTIDFHRVRAQEQGCNRNRLVCVVVELSPMLLKHRAQVPMYLVGELTWRWSKTVGSFGSVVLSVSIMDG